MAQAGPHTDKVDQLVTTASAAEALTGILCDYKTFSRGLEILSLRLQLLDLHAFSFAAIHHSFCFSHQYNLQCFRPKRDKMLKTEGLLRSLDF